MALPNFLGLGAQRAGSTWLYEALKTHPDIFLPKTRKEVHFFDRYYDRGIDWYRRFFEEADASENFRWIGEITPMYLYEPSIPSKINASLKKGCKFLVVLRHPVKRAYSQYSLDVRYNNLKISFEEYFKNNKDVRDRGLYAEQLKRYFSFFDPKDFLILIFEEVMKDQAEAIQKVASFFNIDPNEFSLKPPHEKVNASYRPKFAGAYALAHRVSEAMYKSDNDWLINIAKKISIPKLFGNKGSLAPLDGKLCSELMQLYQDDIEQLEDILEKNLKIWHER